MEIADPLPQAGRSASPLQAALPAIHSSSPLVLRARHRERHAIPYRPARTVPCRHVVRQNNFPAGEGRSRRARALGRQARSAFELARCVGQRGVGEPTVRHRRNLSLRVAVIHGDVQAVQFLQRSPSDISRLIWNGGGGARRKCL